MKFEVKNRLTGNVQFTADIECEEYSSYSVKIGLSVKWGLKNGANLAGAYLARANLAGAYLADADLAGADLAGAYLADAYLARADLAGAYLARADLAGADLARANLADAYLARADLAGADLAWSVLDKEKDIFLQGDNPVLMLNPIGSEDGTLLAYKTNKGIYLRRGRFFGAMKDFLAAVQEKHGDRHHGAVYRAACQFIEVWYGEEKRKEVAE